MLTHPDPSAEDVGRLQLAQLQLLTASAFNRTMLLDLSIQMREEGNALFRSAQLTDAHKKYSGACLVATVNYNVDKFGEAAEAYVLALSNRAQCALKLGEVRLALMDIWDALTVCTRPPAWRRSKMSIGLYRVVPGSEKAYWDGEPAADKLLLRRSKAFAAIGKFS